MFNLKKSLDSGRKKIFLRKIWLRSSDRDITDKKLFRISLQHDVWILISDCFFPNQKKEFFFVRNNNRQFSDMGGASTKTNNDIEGWKSVKMNSGYIRRAYHAGSWYSDDEATLDSALSQYLAEAAKEDDHRANSRDASLSPETTSLRAIICPHAGFSYSGPTAAYGYNHLEQELAKQNSPIRHILVFHPSHHIYLDGCAISGAQTIKTPLGDLPVATDLRDEILNLAGKKKSRGGSTVSFSVMDRDVDESEHSGEMQYPFIAKVQKAACKTKGSTWIIPILPIMCGNISNSKESEYGSLLADIVARNDVLSVVSSDFCHWGHRFSYQPTPTSTGPKTTLEIFEFIQNLDRQGMRHIEMKEPGAFAKYLKETRNTICGRHAIQIWLNAVVHAERARMDSVTCKSCGNNSGALNIEFNKYAQSSNVRSMRESSVSYASAIARAPMLL